MDNPESRADLTLLTLPYKPSRRPAKERGLLWPTEPDVPVIFPQQWGKAWGAYDWQQEINSVIRFCNVTLKDVSVTAIKAQIEPNYMKPSPSQLHIGQLFTEASVAVPDTSYEREVRKSRASRSSEAQDVLTELREDHQIPYGELPSRISDLGSLLRGVSYLYAAGWVTLGKTRLKLNPRYEIDRSNKVLDKE